MSFRQSGLFYVLVLLTLSMTSTSHASQEITVPRLSETPIIDGRMDEAAWVSAVEIPIEPQERCKMRAGFNEAALWLALQVEQPGQGTLEITLRVTDCMEEQDRFIVDTQGNKQLTHQRIGAISVADEWQAVAQQDKDTWSVEMRIPFETLGIQPVPGNVFEARVTISESGRKTHEAASFSRLYLETHNLLGSPDLSDRSQWGFTEGDEAFYTKASDAVRMQTPGRYSTMSQGLQLQPQAFYRLEAEVKGNTSIYIRARTSRKQGERSNAYSTWTQPGEEFRKYVVYFPTGETGEASIIIGSTESSRQDAALLRNLSVVREIQYESAGPRIELRETDANPTVVEKVLVEDCRALRGFIASPVDGRLDSPRWDAGVWEYKQRGAGAGVGYDYNNNDGLHITLADNDGVDALLVRGGAKATLYGDGARYDDPADASQLAALSGMAQIERIAFPSRVSNRKFSFFGVENGLLADITFLRIHRESERLNELGDPVSWMATSATDVPEELTAALEQQFHDPAPLMIQLSPEGTPGTIVAEPKRAVHLISAPLDVETPLAAVALEAQVKSPGSVSPFTIVVHDPINPLVELIRTDFVLLDSEKMQCVLDFPDQVFPAGTRLWVSLSFLGDATLRDVAVTPYCVTRERAVPEALAYRKLQMQGLFSSLSEARPWRRWRRSMDMEQWLDVTGNYASYLRELVIAIETCKSLSGTVDIQGVATARDDLVRQYDEWFHRTHQRLQPYEPEIDSVPGAPEWAVVARQAWLTARAVPEWWLKHRLVPTGEFGGRVGDDSDMYQNLLDFPMMEDGEFTQKLKNAARDLMSLAEQTILEQGLNLRTMDPLHAYEEGLNQESLMLLWDYGDPVAFERCLTASRSLQSLTVVTPQGHRHFKSQECGAEDLRIDRPTDVDGHAHPLMLHPAFEAAWYSGNPTILKFLKEWADGWLEHMEPGEYATSVEVATEKVVATTNRPLYGGYGGLGSAMLFMYWLTDDARYLEPFMEIWQKASDNTSPHNLLPEMFHRGALEPLGDETLQQLTQGRGIAEWLVTGNKEPLIDALKGSISELQRFPAMYTTAEVFTDRVFLYGITQPAIAYTGGYATRNKLIHTHAVSWEGFGTDFAALVKLARPDRLTVLLYNFESEPLEGAMRVWTLRPGSYQLHLGIDEDGDDTADVSLESRDVMLQRADTIPLTLPPKQVIVLELIQTEAHPKLFPLPDLAISAQDIYFEGDILVVPIHNIGSADAPATEIVVKDDHGQILAREQVPSIAAPLDLVPKIHTLRLSIPALAPGTMLQIELDAANQIREIYEGNNVAVDLEYEAED
ncbi:hypothetical protein ACFL6S_13130 [Candidatus Poribacteria bacterium]